MWSRKLRSGQFVSYNDLSFQFVSYNDLSFAEAVALATALDEWEMILYRKYNEASSSIPQQ